MTQQHPFVPPAELVSIWVDLLETRSDEEVFSMAAQWGADQELEACCTEVAFWENTRIANLLRESRRPKPPSLKEQALKAAYIELDPEGKNGSLIIRALEQLDV